MRPPFHPLPTDRNYLPIEDHGCIGDGSTAALVARDGSVDWLCVPRFDSAPLFCAILDHRRGGAFRVAADEARESRQYYEEDTPILHTEIRTESGLLRITDALTLHLGADLSEDVPAARRELVRRFAAVQGEVTVKMEIAPRGGANTRRAGAGVTVIPAGRSDLDLHVTASAPIHGLVNAFTLSEGDTVDVALRWNSGSVRHKPLSASQAIEQTAAAWRRWVRDFRYNGPQAAVVKRSAITLKLLDHFENGAILAAPTSSLPEAIGGVRNWDYRYAWIRDAALSVYALHRIGYSTEAARFLAWVLDAVERDGAPRVLYNIDGQQPDPEVVDPELEGYRQSAPVRWGNGAADQQQNDAYGEILDCAYQWAAHHGGIEAPIWDKLRRLVDTAQKVWRVPDHGIWEVRTPGRPFTYSAAMCHVALDRGARLGEKFGLPGDVEGWRQTSATIVQTILEDSWDESLRSLSEHFGEGAGQAGGLDASLLALPLRRVIPARHPKMIATTEAICSRLGAGNGLLFRYLPDESPDGLPGHEGAFLLCSFWLVDNLAGQGRLQEAMDLYDSLCARAGSLCLLPEQIDPATGAFLGNYPQAFSHIGVIASGFNLGRLLDKAGARGA